jgi:hypothetical protein
VSTSVRGRELDDLLLFAVEESIAYLVLTNNTGRTVNYSHNRECLSRIYDM